MKGQFIPKQLFFKPTYPVCSSKLDFVRNVQIFRHSTLFVLKQSGIVPWIYNVWKAAKSGSNVPFNQRLFGVAQAEAPVYCLDDSVSEYRIVNLFVCENK